MTGLTDARWVLAEIDRRVRTALDEVHGGDLGTVMVATVNAYSDACRDLSANLPVTDRDDLTLARVRALAEGPGSDGYRPYAVIIGTETHFAVLLDDLRGALDGGDDQ